MDKSSHAKELLKLNDSDKKTLQTYQNFVIETPKKEATELKTKEVLVKI